MQKKTKKENKTMKLIYYTESTGRLYANGKWIGNFYTDSNGIIRDSETGREVLA